MALSGQAGTSAVSAGPPPARPDAGETDRRLDARGTFASMAVPPATATAEPARRHESPRFYAATTSRPARS